MKAKRGLYLLLAAGLLGLAAGGGTFASFNAQTSNPNNTFATGSLYLSDTANGGTACFSYAGTNNANGNCQTIVTAAATGVAPGATAATGTVVVANVGTISASALTLYSSACTDSDRTVVVPGVTVTSGSHTIAVPSGTWAADGVDPNMVVSLDSNGNIPVNDTISAFTESSITLTTAATGTGTDSLTFKSTASFTGNPLCGAVAASIQEGTGCVFPTVTPGTACTALSNSSTSYLSTLPASGAPLALGSIAPGASDSFTVDLYLPNTAGNQNTLMDLESNFGLTFTAAQ